MKHIKIFTAIFFLTLFSTTYAQRIIPKGEKILNFGINSGLGPYLGFDVGYKKNISVGAQLGVNFFPSKAIFVIVRGDYHFNELLKVPEKFDLYAGLATGVSYNYLLTAQIGARYKFNENWDLNFEIGGGTHFYGKLGVTRKIFTSYVGKNPM